MFIRWFLAIIFSLQVFTALASDLPGNPADDTPQQSLDRWKQHVQKQDAYDRNVKEVIASIGKDSQGRQSIQQIVNKHAVLPDGSKAELKTVVTQTPNKTKVAQVLTERLKNAKDYAKNLGKASIPSFVGMAAFHGLMEGIGWVMDEGGQVQWKPDSPDVPKVKFDPTHPSVQYYYMCLNNGQNTTFYGATEEEACHSLGSAIVRGKNSETVQATVSGYTYCNSQGCYTPYTFTNSITGVSGSATQSTGYTRRSNSNYKPGTPAPTVDLTVTPAQIETSVKNALESNNAALAAAIADAIKSAYSYDGSEGQKPSSNTLAKEAADDMSVALPKAFDNPVPTSNPERPSGYYKITDGDKTVEGYVTPAPIGGTTDTTTTPTIDPVTGQPTGGTSTTGGFQLPAFCDWAAVVCDFIDWVKSDEELPEDKEPQVDTSLFDRKFDFSFNASAQCPPNPIWNFTFINQEWSKELDITMICQMFRWLGFAINIASNMTALWIVYSAVVVRDKA